MLLSHTCKKVIFGRHGTNMQIISPVPGITLLVCFRTRNLDLILRDVCMQLHNHCHSGLFVRQIRNY